MKIYLLIIWLKLGWTLTILTNSNRVKPSFSKITFKKSWLENYLVNNLFFHDGKSSFAAWSSNLPTHSSNCPYFEQQLQMCLLIFQVSSGSKAVILLFLQLSIFTPSLLSFLTISLSSEGRCLKYFCSSPSCTFLRKSTNSISLLKKKSSVTITCLKGDFTPKPDIC